MSHQLGEDYEQAVKEYYLPKWIKLFTDQELSALSANTHGFDFPKELLEMYREKGTLIIGYQDSNKFWHEEFSLKEPKRMFNQHGLSSLAGQEYFWKERIPKDEYDYITHNYCHFGHLDLGLDTIELLFHRSVEGFGTLTMSEDGIDSKTIHLLATNPKAVMNKTLEEVIIYALYRYADWRLASRSL